MYRTMLALLCVFVLTTNAEARHRRHHWHVKSIKTIQQPTFNFFQPVQQAFEPVKQGIRKIASNVQMLAHPAGCPARAFCGCGAAVAVFGKPVRSLWLAAAWYKFPRAAPAPGMVAVRSHHVFVLREHRGGSTWLVEDYNSGRHQSRLHDRSIAGLAIVNPRG